MGVPPTNLIGSTSTAGGADYIVGPERGVAALAPWVRLEDTYPINRKVGLLSDGAFRLDVEAICWSAREAADGVIRADELVLVRARATKKQAAELVPRALARSRPDPARVRSARRQGQTAG